VSQEEQLLCRWHRSHTSSKSDAQAKRQRKDSAGRKEGGQSSGRASWPAGKVLTAQQAFNDSASAAENVHWQVRLCVMPALLYMCTAADLTLTDLQPLRDIHGQRLPMVHHFWRVPGHA
jgi:hypothetical protein